MSPLGDKIGYVCYALKPTSRRTCKTIKNHICKALAFKISYERVAKITEEERNTVIHNAFVRAIDELEEYGYLTLDSLENIVYDEYWKVTGANEFKEWHEYDYLIWGEA